MVVDFEHFITPQRLANALVRMVFADIWKEFHAQYPDLKDQAFIVLDPCAGTGVFGDALRAFDLNSYLIGVELDDLPRPMAYDRWITKRRFQDITTHHFPVTHDGEPMIPNVVITNPPFKQWEEIVRHTLALADEHNAPMDIIMYLRAAAYWGVARAKWLDTTPLYRIIATSPRPTFKSSTPGTEKSSDPRTEYAAVWWRTYNGVRPGDPVSLSRLIWR